jgi:hypothetical protein
MAVISATQPPEGIYSTGTASATLTVNSSECMENPCQNYGICVEEFRDYVCVCQPGFTGPNCQNIILIGGGDAGQAYNYDPNNVLACFVGAGRGSMISYSPALPPKKIL